MRRGLFMPGMIARTTLSTVTPGRASMLRFESRFSLKVISPARLLHHPPNADRRNIGKGAVEREQLFLIERVNSRRLALVRKLVIARRGEWL
jgi:hypothetical protein